MIGVILIVRPPFLFPNKGVNVSDPFWDYSADDTRGNSSVVLFSSEFWTNLYQNGKKGVFTNHLDRK